MNSFFSGKPSGPRGLPVVGNLFQFRRDPLAFLRVAASYGEIVNLRLLKPTYLLNNYEYAGHVLAENAENYTKGPLNRRLKPFLGEGLLTSDGSWWRYQRRLIQPFFQRDQLAHLIPIISQSINNVCSRWEEFANRGEPINIQEEMIKVTSAIIGHVVLGSALASDTERLSAAVTIGLRIAQRRAGSPFPLPLWIPTPLNRQANRSLTVLMDIIQDHINRRNQLHGTPCDLLSVLMEARDEQGHAMSKAQLSDQLITVLLAGYETSATALSWLWYLLAEHQDIQENVANEIAQFLPRDEGSFDMNGLSNLVYTTATIQETLRLYPPSWLLHRQAIKQDTIGGVTIPAGRAVLISPYLLHRHPLYWSDVDKFQPARFTPEYGTPPPKYCYLPFGGGPRYCVGSQLAVMEAQIIVSQILKKFRVFRWNDDVIQPEAAVTLRPNQPILLGVKLARPHSIQTLQGTSVSEMTTG